MFMVTAVLAFVSFSCKKPTGQAQRDLEQELLKKYIARYHPTVTPKRSGLYFIETKAAPATDTTFIKAGDIVKVFYEGYLIEEDDTAGIRDGYNFEFTGDYEPFTFTVGTGAVISGWDEAMTYMKEGSEAKLIVPSKLAYSGQSQSSIPPYSPLVFFIRVYKVYNDSTDVVYGKLPKKF